MCSQWGGDAPTPGGGCQGQTLGELTAEKGEMGFLFLKIRGNYGRKMWVPRIIAKWRSGVWRELTPDGLNFLYKNQVRSSDKCQLGGEQKQNGKQREERLFLKFSAASVLHGGGRD